MQKDKLRTRTPEELSVRMDGLIVLKDVLNSALDDWFLSGGTLLGACRDGDFIPWDWDVEVTVLTEEASQKEGALIKALLKAGFDISSYDPSFENFKIVAEGWGTEYEILGRYYNKEKDTRARIMTETPAKFFQQKEMINFRGHIFPAPSPSSGFLESLYSDWRTPKKTSDKKEYFSASSYQVTFIGRVLRRAKRFKNILSRLFITEFPRITPSQIEGFKSWDRELGWCNQSNVVKVDKSDRSIKRSNSSLGLAVFSIDEKGSRICSNPDDDTEISIYGDSYSMCRDVQDEETFAWYLGEMRGTRVGNYGVGNYGVDQALLRLERDYHKDPAKFVVIAVPTITMARSVSVYRHYLEPGNIFAIKPRFILDEGSEKVRLVPYPLKDKTEFKYLNKYKYFFRKYDEHYQFWKKYRFNFYFKQIPVRVLNRLGIGKKPVPFKSFEYEASFWRSHENLFYGMMGFYQDLANKNGFKPIFLLMHMKRSLEFIQGKEYCDIPWKSVLSTAAKKFPGIIFLDQSDFFSDYEKIDEFYTKTHHSPKANKIIAEYLNKVIGTGNE